MVDWFLPNEDMSSNDGPMLLYIRECTMMMRKIVVLGEVLKPLPGEDLLPLGPTLGTKKLSWVGFCFSWSKINI